jgi:hypothetical protein
MSTRGYVALILTAGAFALLVPGSASAYTDPPVKLGTQPQYLPDSEGLVAAGTPRTLPVPPKPGWYEAQEATSSEFDVAASTELESESASLIARVGAWGWELAPPVAVSAVGLGAGYLIGTKIYGLFSDSGPAPTGSNTYFADHWQLVKPGSMLLSDATGNVYAPSWGVWEYNSSVYSGKITDTHACETILWGSGKPIYAPGWIAASRYNYCGIHQYQNYVLFKPGIPVECGVVRDCSGITPVNYNGANQPAVPTAQQLQDRTLTELESGNYPLTNAFINHMEDPENYPDPRVTRTKQDHRCDRSTPTYFNPDTGSAHAPFDPYYPWTFAVTNRPPGYDLTDVYLRYGTTDWGPTVDPTRTPFARDDWLGWGWRKIAAKHGWSELDRSETQLALTEAAPVPAPDDSGNWDYILPVDPGAGGVSCERIVAVDFRTGDGDPAPRGIVTSFNAVGQ